MRSYVGTHEVRTTEDLVELALDCGTDAELWLGHPGESREERAARLDAAVDILTDDPELAPAVATVMTAALNEDPDLLPPGHRDTGQEVPACLR